MKRYIMKDEKRVNIISNNINLFYVKMQYEIEDFE